MKQKTLFIFWGGMYILCGLLGLGSGPAGAGRVLLTLAFFLPPFLIFRKAKGSQDRQTLRLLRDLSAASLGLTVLLIGLNVAAFNASETVGNLLHVLLVFLSSPMVCGGNWLISLFLWACLLIASGRK